MDITWLGQACFQMKGSDATIITDPFNESLGYDLGSPTADYVTVSHGHPDHSYIQGVGGSPEVIRGLGNYSFAGVRFYGIGAFHDQEGGAIKGPNIIYLIEFEGLKIAHLGDLGHVPTAGQLSQLSGVDVLMIPVGGYAMIDARAAVETIGLLNPPPRIVVPMHYDTEAWLNYNFDKVDRFLNEMGVSGIQPQPRLNVTKDNLPVKTQVVLLDYKH